MTEDKAKRTFYLNYSVLYDNDVVDVYFDLIFVDEVPCMSDGWQVFYKGANITDLVDYDKIDDKINWKQAIEDMRPIWEEDGPI